MIHSDAFDFVKEHLGSLFLNESGFENHALVGDRKFGRGSTDMSGCQWNGAHDEDANARPGYRARSLFGVVPSDCNIEQHRRGRRQ